MKNKNENSIFLLISSLMTFSVSLASIQYTDLDYYRFLGIPAILLFSFVFSYLCKPIFKSAMSTIISLGVLLTALSGVYFLGYYSSIENETNASISEFFTFLREFIFDWHVGMIKPESYQRIIIIGIVFLIAIITHLSIYRFKKAFIAIILATLIFTAQWALIHEVQKLAFYIYLPTVFLLYIFAIHNKKMASLDEDEQKHFQKKSALLKIAAPILLISLFFVVLFPLNRGAIQIKWLDAIVKENQFRTKTMKYDEFSLVESGFSTGSGLLNSRVALNSTEVLNIYGDEPLYLKGAAYDLYTGNRWLQNEEEYKLSYLDRDNSRIQALDELYYGSKLLLLSKEMNEFENDIYHDNPFYLYTALSYKENSMNYDLENLFFDSKVATIVYKNLQTKSLFTPPYSRLINSNQYESISINKDEVFTNSLALTEGQRISLEYIDLNYNQDDFLMLISNSREGFYYDVSLYLDQFSDYIKKTDYSSSNEIGISIPTNGFTYAEFTDNYQFYKNKLATLMEEAQHNITTYTSLPNTISDRVRLLAYALTKNADSTYEKVKNIETYFKYDFTYTLSPTPMTEDQEFVDFFLFESKEGYCSSFATAMTVLVRSLGIPARYVEGYVMPNKTVDDNLFVVRNSNAHAWVEVYFEGFGWVSFEPTFAFSYTQDEKYTGSSTLDEDLINRGQYSDYIDNLIDEEFIDDFDPTLKEGPSPSPTPYSIGPIEQTEAPSTNVGLIAIILLSLLVLIYIYIKLSRMYKFRHIHSNKDFTNRYLHIIKTLSNLKYDRITSQTLIEYSNTIDDIFTFGDFTFTDITNIYYQVIYSNHTVTEEDCNKLRLFYKSYVIALKDDVDLIDYIVKRYIFPII